MSMSNLWLRQFFKNDGEILDVYVPNRIRKGKNYKFGFVKFKRKSDVDRAIRRNRDFQIKGMKIVIQRARFEK